MSTMGGSVQEKLFLFLACWFCCVYNSSAEYMLHKVTWSPSTCRFGNTTKAPLTVYLHDQVDFVCPTKPDIVDPSSAAHRYYFKIYKVTEGGYKAYDTSLGQHIFSCNSPTRSRRYTLDIAEFSAIPGAMDFKCGNHYYFIARTDGTRLCRSHQVRLSMFVRCEPRVSETTLSSTTANGRTRPSSSTSSTTKTTTTIPTASTPTSTTTVVPKNHTNTTGVDNRGNRSQQLVRDETTMHIVVGACVSIAICLLIVVIFILVIVKNKRCTKSAPSREADVVYDKPWATIIGEFPFPGRPVQYSSPQQAAVQSQGPELPPPREALTENGIYAVTSLYSVRTLSDSGIYLGGSIHHERTMEGVYCSSDHSERSEDSGVYAVPEY